MGRCKQGDPVFVPGTDEAFIPGRVVQLDRHGEGADVQLLLPNGSPGETQFFASEDIRSSFKQERGVTSEDNTSLVHLNDATILDNLRRRHTEDKIYTYTASVLLAVNPYKEIKTLYGDDECIRYRGKHIGALPPHPYAIADSAYRALKREQQNQGMLISGESGAGKTETAKIVMQFLAFTSGSTSAKADDIQSRVLNAQPILESFGNAVTMRNSNSSRFGKYNKVFFDVTGGLVDAGITTYLLEASRVVVHGERERTYHCFYEMLQGLDQTTLEEFGLQRDGNYRLLCDPAGQCITGFEQRDSRNFQRLCESFKTVGLEDATIQATLRLLAGLIHLGNMERQDDSKPDSEDDDKYEIDHASVDQAARMLGMDADQLCARLTRKKVAVPGRRSFHEVTRSRSQFRQALQSFIKALYKRLFDWTVQRINDSFAELRSKGLGTEDGWRHIGILDIYGFERLQRNSFEQLCINLANERLQQYFVENVLLAEQDLYKREGLPWMGISLPDATPVFNAIGQVFKTLDEYSQNLSKAVGNASDENFCTKIVAEASKDQERKEVLKKLKVSGGRSGSKRVDLTDGFIIKHYAGEVEYTTQGWLDKNNDRLLPECEALIKGSTEPLVQSLAEKDDNAKVLFRSISKKYSKDLDSLLDALSTSSLHYIRCFKPNGEQKPDLFKGAMVLDQIVQCGTIELVKIMHDGYPNRCAFEEITTRFRDLLPEKFQRYGMRTFIEALMMAYDVPRQAWDLGMSRLFLKAGQMKALEDMRKDGATPCPDKLAKIVRGIIAKRWKRAIHAVSLCNYIPKYIQWIKERRAAVRRRLAAAFKTVRLAKAIMGDIRQKRALRVAKAFRIAMLLHSKTRPWAAGAKQRVADRKREEARRQALEDAQRKELEKLEEEKRQQEQKLREEMQRQEDECRQRAEAEVAAEEQRQKEEAAREEQRQKEEAARLELERQQEEMKQKMQKEEEERTAKALAEAEERRAFAEERQRFEESKRELEEQKRQLEEDRLRQEREKFEEEKKAFEEQKRLGQERAIRAAASPAKSRAVPWDSDQQTEVGVDDSASNVGTAFALQAKREMEESVKRLEREMASRHEEIKQQMMALQEKNFALEKQLEEERYHKDVAESPPRSQRAGIDDHPRHLMTPDTGRKKAPKMSHRTSRKSLLSLDGNATQPTGRRRNSVAAEALTLQATAEAPQAGGHTIGQAAEGQDLPSQRKWWAEQRQYLLDDLYGPSM